MELIKMCLHLQKFLQFINDLENTMDIYNFENGLFFSLYIGFKQSTHITFIYLL